MLEIILWILGLTFGYFLIKEAVRKGILEAHEELGDYHPPITKPVQKKTEQKPEKNTQEATQKPVQSRTSGVINNWICPHCDAINTSEHIRCVQCGKLPTER